MLKNVIGRHAADSTRVSPPSAEGPEDHATISRAHARMTDQRSSRSTRPAPSCCCATLHLVVGCVRR